MTLPSLTKAAYNASTGVLTLNGTNLTTSGYAATDFTLKGDGGTSYTLTGGSAVSGTPTSSSVPINWRSMVCSIKMVRRPTIAVPPIICRPRQGGILARVRSLPRVLPLAT